MCFLYRQIHWWCFLQFLVLCICVKQSLFIDIPVEFDNFWCLLIWKSISKGALLVQICGIIVFNYSMVDKIIWDNFKVIVIFLNSWRGLKNKFERLTKKVVWWQENKLSLSLKSKLQCFFLTENRTRSTCRRKNQHSTCNRKC